MATTDKVLYGKKSLIHADVFMEYRKFLIKLLNDDFKKTDDTEESSDNRKKINTLIGQIIGITRKYLTTEHPAVKGLSFILVKMLTKLQELGYDDLISDLYQVLGIKGATIGPLIVQRIPSQLYPVWHFYQKIISKSKNKKTLYEILSENTEFQAHTIMLFTYINEEPDLTSFIQNYMEEIEQLIGSLNEYKKIPESSAFDSTLVNPDEDKKNKSITGKTGKEHESDDKSVSLSDRQEQKDELETIDCRKNQHR